MQLIAQKCHHFRHRFPAMRKYTAGMGLKIRQIRKQRGLTQAELSDMAGIARSHLSMIETESTPVNTVRLVAISRALGVPVSDLFDDPAEAPYKEDILILMDAMSDEDRQTLLRMARALTASE